MMKNTSITFDQYRRNIRRALFLQRQSDHDNSIARLNDDAARLDAKLTGQGYALKYQTEWGKNRAANLIADRQAKPPQLAIPSLNSMMV
jgi:hypothetical protein